MPPYVTSHGDLLFIGYQTTSVPAQQSPAPSTAAANAALGGAARPWEAAKEDVVDKYWRSQDGKIPRGRDNRFCKHGANAMCDYCMPLEPYDPEYHTKNNIKNLSYHAYLRRATPKASLSSSVTSILPPLNPLSFRVKDPCPTGGHAPWPAGICTACQPSAITL